MKIILVTEYFLPVKGGIEIHCYNLARELKKRGIDVEVHTSKNTPLLRNVLRSKEVIDGIQVIRYRLFKLYLPKNLPYVDVLHLHNFNVLPHGLIFFYLVLRKILKLKIPKIIITLHGGFLPNWKEFPIIIAIIKKLYHMTIGKIFLRYVVDKIICVSSWECRELLKMGLKDKIIFIPNGVEELAFELSSSHDKVIEKLKPYILYIGRISRRKRLELVIQAIKGLNNLKFVVAGPVSDQHYYNDLLELVKKSQLESRVLFIGEVSTSTKYKLIDNALVIVLVSEHEAEGIVVKEAMARGKPVIVSTIPAFNYIKDSVNGFKVNSVDEIKQKIVELLKNDKLRNSISSINRRVARMWRWSKIAEMTIKVYKN